MDCSIFETLAYQIVMCFILFLNYNTLSFFYCFDREWNKINEVVEIERVRELENSDKQFE